MVTWQVRSRTTTTNKAEAGTQNRELVEKHRMTERTEDEIYMGKG